MGVPDAFDVKKRQPKRAAKRRPRKTVVSRLLDTIPFAALSTVALAGWSLYQYSDQSDRELRKLVFAEQLQVYKDLTASASELATWDSDSVDTKAYQVKYRQFRQLMISRASLLQDVHVEREVVEFWHLLERYEPTNPEVTQQELVNSTIKMSFAARDALQRTWGRKLPELKRINVIPDK